MKKIVLLLFLLLLSFPCFAVDWMSLSTKNGSTFFLDKDSILEYNNYYFFNIKVINKYKNEPVVITIQTCKSSPLVARINYYNPFEYEALNGDYEHITDKIVSNFEIVEYGSIAHRAYMAVRSILQSNKIEIKI